MKNLPDPGRLDAAEWRALCEALGERLVAEVLAPHASAAPLEWSELFPKENERALLARMLSPEAWRMWDSPGVLTGWDEEGQRRKVVETATRGDAGALRASLARWFTAGLTERLRTAAPDAFWLVESRAAWSGPDFQLRVARRIFDHLHATTLMHPLPAEFGIAIAPETFWCLLAVAMAPGRPRLLRWWVRLLRWLRLARSFGIDDAEPPHGKLRAVMLGALSEAGGWAGAWDQFLLAGACLRWSAAERWARLPVPLREGLLTLERVAAEAALREAATTSPPTWERAGWEAALPRFLDRQGSWQRSFAAAGAASSSA